ncbi:unnamed protein product (macronuclear) [Paramecium tetraurelia]|uniref:cathepsin L n=1 Tax=Paramecium tetraurelia TaxID=5888 RepID=A0BPC5_PARTE|nr:uncharacterized protein GSPATT00005141001 [Paramecium tetraurelia]CAK60392.1 unnamed protein product [Paramecium tetraurelia]|eukprot:XP_001427790.1 hypothetical protein (macronuclear) [Paramecium tetraurelia strain d4-2]
MSKTLLALGTIALLGTLMMVNQPEQLDFASKYQTFKQKFGKVYSQTEDAYRMAVYTQNVLYAESVNLQQGKRVFGETIFFDLTKEEFAETYLTLKITQEDLNLERIPAKNISAAEKIDWSQKGAVTDVKDQGQCGSCWTFGTTGVLEGFFFKTTGELPNLSEQQLLDCSTFQDFNLGCNGGLPYRALQYVKRSGITTQAAYPYKGVQGSCQIKGGAYRIKGAVQLEATEEALISYLNEGPVSVGVDATNWQYYNPSDEKVFSTCDSSLNHAVLAVGYDKNSLKIKNSWSAQWGDRGYIHLKRDGNTCGVYNTNVVVV